VRCTHWWTMEGLASSAFPSTEWRLPPVLTLPQLLRLRHPRGRSRSLRRTGLVRLALPQSPPPLLPLVALYKRRCQATARAAELPSPRMRR